MANRDVTSIPANADGIVRYLAGRFPETLSATDDDGRTPLHYAATLKDNGHFYNLLTHLGANAKVEDNLNHSAEYYLGHVQSQGILSHRQLLRDYGAKEELADEMLNDQEIPFNRHPILTFGTVPDDLHSARRPLDDVDTLTTLERCYKIIHEPIDDLVRSVGLPTNSVPGSACSLRILITSYLARFLKRSVFDKIKKRQTRLDHNLFDVIWPAMKKATKEKRLDEDLNVGIVMPDYDVFVVFQEFLVPLIKDVHCMELTQPLMPHPPMQYFPRYMVNELGSHGGGTGPSSPPASGTNNGNTLRENPDSVQLNLDTSGKYITGCIVECARNLDAYEFPLNLGIAQLEQVERLITAKVLSMDFVRAVGETELGTYYSMNEILENPSEIRTVLAANGLLIPLLDHTDPYQTAESIAINGRFWPYGRGVYVNLEGNLAVWVNAQDHLRLLCCTPSKEPASIGSAYSKVGRAMNYLEERIPFKHSYFLGNLLSRPSFLGTGLKFTLTLALLHLRKERENLRHLCVVRGLHLFTADDLPTVRMCNMRSMAQTEWQLFQDFSSAITNIVALEKELSMSNSLHIAATLLRIFRKKKHSLATDGSVPPN
ncbi:AGAP009820-PA-like protein [Anopheles sinensis]|uniref:AGAP009820-PA-like protein n=1 Tax=Anopheles sinensis TaxID=74873 RepID=A0A084WG40_ANOSI|nr:AGAP009820-PA-like protein [Anopheles sinensis]